MWSPDGSQIAFDGWIHENGFEIWVMNADGSGLRNLTNTPDLGEYSPSLVAGRSAHPVLAGGDQPRLEVMNSDGTGRNPLASNGAYWASWSPDGTRIAFLVRSERTKPPLHYERRRLRIRCR